LKQKHPLASLVGAMNLAATQDLRPIALLPDLDAALGTAPSARDGQLLDLLNTWLQRGAARLDLNGDGKVDDPGAALMDAAYPRIAFAVLRPALGTLADRLAQLHTVDDYARPG